jgi:hypothetical protein
MREIYPIAAVYAAVLLGTPLPAGGIRPREIRSRGNLKLHEVSDCRETLALLRHESVPVLHCERRRQMGRPSEYHGDTLFEPRGTVADRLRCLEPLGECGFVAISAKKAEAAGRGRMSGSSD